MSEKSDKRIDDILQSAKDIQPVAPGAGMIEAIETRLKKQEEKPASIISMKWLYATAAAMLIIVLLNVMVWSITSRNHEKTGIQTLMRENGWANNDIYFIH